MNTRTLPPGETPTITPGAPMSPALAGFFEDIAYLADLARSRKAAREAAEKKAARKTKTAPSTVNA